MIRPRLHPLVRLLICGLGLIVVQVVFALMQLLGNVMATIWLGHPPTESLSKIVQNYVLPLTFVTFLPSLLWIGICRTRFDRHSFPSLGLRGRNLLSNALKGAIAGGLAVALLWSVLWLCGALQLSGWADEVVQGGGGTTLLALFGYVLLFAGVALFEEISFRGYGLHNLQDWFGWKTAVGVQAGIFAVVHLPNLSGRTADEQVTGLIALPALVLVAVFFALSYRKTGSLWFPIGFHFAWNFCLGPLLSLPVSGIDTFRLLNVSIQGPVWLTGGAFGAEASLLLVPILATLIFFISRVPDHPQALLDLELSCYDTLLAPPPVPTEPEEEEEVRENRFRTKFGSSQGFSAETLQELRELQEERERQQQAAQEALRREQIATSSFAPTPTSEARSLELGSTATVALSPMQPEAPVEAPLPENEEPAPVATPLLVPPSVVPRPAPEAPTTPPSAPASPTPTAPIAPRPEPAGDAPVKKRPPSPRW